jgi:DNA topoisomerase I
VTTAEALVKLGPRRSATDAKRKINAAIDAAAQRLNNTRAVCRNNYVDPRVPESYPDGSLAETFTRTRKRPQLSRAESAVLLLVQAP